MPEQSVTKRTRASVPRPRSGCNTCKRRHVKCDETKPQCQKCVQTGRKCDGYSAQATRPGSRPPTLADSLWISSYEIPFKIPGSQNDRRIFHYYCVHASHDLAGPSESDFWTRLVLQCSQDEPVVRSALLALSYEHLDYIAREPGFRLPSVAQDSSSLEGLQQHHKAVRQLRRYIGTSKKPSVKAVLVCCILFFHFECSRDNPATALLHLRNGLAILGSQRAPDASPSLTEALAGDEDMQELVKILSRLDLQGSMMDTQRIPELQLVSEDIRRGLVPCVGLPGFTFQTLSEADVALAKLEHWAVRFISENMHYQHVDLSQLPAHVTAEKTELIEQCTRAIEALDSFEVNNFTIDTSPKQRAYLAELRLGVYCTLTRIHGHLPLDKSILSTSNWITQKMLEQLAITIPSLAASPRPRVASVGGGGASSSRVPSPSGDDSGDEGGDENASSGAVLLQPPQQNTRSRSASPSPLPDSVTSNRSFCAQSCNIATLLILAAKTTSRAHREQLVALLSQVPQRREGAWNAATASAILRRLQQMADQHPEGVRSNSFASSKGISLEDLASASDTDFLGNRGDESDDEGGAGYDDDDLDSDAARATSERAPAVQTAWFASSNTLTPRAREYASHMLDGRPFCAVAACLPPGYHGERCIWCEERPRSVFRGAQAPPGNEMGGPVGGRPELSLEDLGARLAGGVSGFERLLQERGRK